MSQENGTLSLEDARLEIGNAWRVLGHYGVVDTIFNHISLACMSPGGQSNCFAINPLGVLPTILKAHEVLVLDVSTPDAKDSMRVNPDGLALHSAIHRRREGKATAIVHLHSPYAVAVGSSMNGLLPLSQTALEFVDEVKYFPYRGLFGMPGGIDEDLIEHAAVGCVALLRNHGTLVVADSVAEAVYVAYYLEEACRLQVLALTAVAGKGAMLVAQDVIGQTGQRLRETRTMVAKEFFRASVAMLEELGR